MSEEEKSLNKTQDINLSELNELASSESVTIYPNDVRFDVNGKAIIVNDKASNFVRETLRETGSAIIMPGGDRPELKADVNVFCHFHINLKKGCSAKE
ncbi:MAG: hypothetical protein LC115_07135 [Bacteroidia bacterium]|nr:hypothetical protein [Bacteroidia bacterium]